MPEPLSAGALLAAAATAIAKSTGGALSKGALAAWKQERRVQAASTLALDATVRLHGGRPGARLALNAWAESPAFDLLLLDASLGETAELSEDRVVASFRENGGAGWDARDAAEVTNDFLVRLFDELAKGEEGHVLAARLARARAAQASAERCQIQTAADAAREAAEEAASNTRDINQVKALLEELTRASPDGRLPEHLASAIRDGVFEEIGRHLDDEPGEALALADRSSDRAEAAARHDGERYAPALRPYRQRLLLAAANAAARLLDADTARARAQAAFALGPVDASLVRQAVDATFNAALPDELRRLAERIPSGSPERARADALLACLSSEWDEAARQLDALGDPSLVSMRAGAEIARLDPSRPDDVQRAARLLDQYEASEPHGALTAARLSVHLLDRVLRGVTPLAFDRRPLVEATHRRARAALEATPPETYLRASALALLGAAGEALLDGPLVQEASDGLLALPESIRDRVTVPHGSTPADIAAAVAEERITPGQAALLTARNQLRLEDRPAAAATLREALFQTTDADDRIPLLDLLLATLRQDGNHADAEALLAATPIPDVDRWVLAQRDDQPLDLRGADALPPDPRVLRQVAHWLLRTTAPLGRDEDGDVIRPEAVGVSSADARPSHWTERLTEALPSRSSRSLHAEALLHDAEFEALLSVVPDLDAEAAPRPAELEAFALQGLGRLLDAARVMTEAAHAFPGLERVALNAAAIWLQLRKGKEARDLLEPFVSKGTDTVAVLVNYAMALRETAPGDRDAASQAFDALGRAYDQQPSKRLAMQAWMTARAAGREAEAGPYFQAMTATAKTVEIQTPEDAERALTDPIDSGFVAFTGDFTVFAEVLAAKEREGRERTDRINTVSTAHAISYADTFRVSGHSWEHWTRWTQGTTGGSGYAVLTDWPSSSHVLGRRLDASSKGVYADLTALLTLGVLGRADAATLLAAAAPVYVATGMLDRISDDIDGLHNAISVPPRAGDAAAVERFEGTDAVVAYDAAVEASAPDAPELGAARVDLGVAVHLGGRYVSDLDHAGAAGEHVVTSASVLHTLHLDGLVERAAAERAARDHPGAFGTWEKSDPLATLPKLLVFDRFALADWAAAGLLEALPVSIRVGPWAWSEVLADVRRAHVATLAYARAKDTLDVLREAKEAGQLREIDAVEPVDLEEPERLPEHGDAGEADDAADSSREVPWREALRSVRTAQAHGLDLWADDRFYSLLLWMGGPVVDGPATEAVLAALAEAGDLPLPIPTVDLAARLARDGVLPVPDARRLAGLLFDQGYRPAHPLALADTLDRFPIPPAPPLRGRARAVADAVRAVPDYLPETIPLAKRQGFARVAAAEVAEQFIALAWTHPGLEEAQRRVLADAFLDAVEEVFAQQTPAPSAPRSDRTRLLFWRGLASTFFATPLGEDETAGQRDAALRWLGDAAAQRPDPYRDIVRLLEDNASSAVELTPGVDDVAAALARSGNADADPVKVHAEAVGRFAFSALVPLLGSRLLSALNPLLRRTVGALALLDRGGRVDTQFNVIYDGQELTTTVPEEENELAAINLVRRVARGDSSLAACVRATEVQFTYNRPPPADWIAAGVPEDVSVPVDVTLSLFALLWADAPDVHPLLVAQLIYQLARVDPPLALLLLDAQHDLLSGDERLLGAARNALALGLLQSGFYELQRDLGHAAWRVRGWPADRLARFVGWVGSEDAQRLAAASPESGLVTLGNSVVSRNHFLGRQALTDAFSDEADVLEAVRATVAGDAPAPIPDLAAWLANRRETAEEADDPFVASYALRHVLLALRAGADHPEAAGWASSYLATALSPLDPSAGPLSYHLSLSREIARSALQLAAFATFGPHHIEAYNADEDPLSEWLDRTWLLTSQLMLALPAIHGDLARAASEATRASRDLGLDAPSFQVQDAFDPFVFAETDDLGRTLTLAAVHSSLDPDAAQTPPWWSSDLERTLSEIAAPPDVLGLPEAELGNRLGLRAPLREHVLARAILDAVYALPERREQ